MYYVLLESSVSTYSLACPKHTRNLHFDIVVVVHQAQHHKRSWSSHSPYTPGVYGLKVLLGAFAELIFASV